MAEQAKSVQNRLELARVRAAELRAAGEFERLDPIQKARRNPKSLRLAINGKCWDCEGAGADPKPRARIADCRVPSCPLYPVRPYQKQSRLTGDD
jgi:hypothetical protein